MIAASPTGCNAFMAGLVVVPAIAVAILCHTVKRLQSKQWWFYPG